MLSGKKLSLIGAGQMGEAMLRGFLEAGVLTSEQIIINDINADRLASLKSAYGVDYSLESGVSVKQSDIVLLSVKPQQIQETIDSFKNDIKDGSILISIAAGVTTRKLKDYAGRDMAVVRVMPNTPALVGNAMSVLCRGEFADDDAMEIALELFKSVGEAIELPENEINTVTAISGSGPAYFFLFVEKLIDAAMEAGLTEDVAIKLARQTFIGSASLLKSSEKSPGALREMVTSPGGTTAAALQIFNNHEFGSIVQEAVNAAIYRAGELA